MCGPQEFYFLIFLFCFSFTATSRYMADVCEIDIQCGKIFLWHETYLLRGKGILGLIYLNDNNCVICGVSLIK